MLDTSNQLKIKDNVDLVGHFPQLVWLKLKLPYQDMVLTHSLNNNQLIVIVIVMVAQEESTHMVFNIIQTMVFVLKQAMDIPLKMEHAMKVLAANQATDQMVMHGLQDIVQAL